MGSNADKIFVDVQCLGHVIDRLRETKGRLAGAPIEVTNPLHMAAVSLDEAQRALIYELGMAVRAEKTSAGRCS